MAMTQRQFEELVSGLQEYARREPKKYVVKIGAFAALGFAYIFAVLLVLLLLLILLGVLGAAIFAASAKHLSMVLILPSVVLVVLIGLVLKSLKVDFPKPEGLPLVCSQAPALFAMLNDVCDRLRAPRFHHVILNDKFNAGVVQLPRLGVFGWQVNYLILGLPLMQALSSEQFRAVLAHEVGHLSHNHNRFSGWIYRLRKTWSQIMGNLIQRGHRGSFLFDGFMKWYAPFFSAYSFVLARQNEYIADRAAAEIVGVQTMAQTLVATNVREQFLSEKFWPGILKQAKQTPEIPAAPFAEMFRELQSGFNPIEIAKWFDQAISERTGFTDTHPSLADRLNALGVSANAQTERKERMALMPAAPAETAAQCYLGASLPRCLDHITQSWRRDAAPAWRSRHCEAQKATERLRELWTLERGRPLTKEERGERIKLTLEFHDETDAIPLLEAEIAAEPKAVGARLFLGRILLARGDVRGIEWMEQAIAIDDGATRPACDQIVYYLQGVGRYADAAAYRERADARRAQELVASEERDDLKAGDRFVYHCLDLQKLTQVKRALGAIPQIAEAYLARKHVTTFREKPLYVVAIALTSSAQKALDEGYSPDALGQDIVRALDLSAETFYIVLNKSNRTLGNAIKNAPSAKIL